MAWELLLGAVTRHAAVTAASALPCLLLLLLLLPGDRDTCQLCDTRHCSGLAAAEQAGGNTEQFKCGKQLWKRGAVSVDGAVGSWNVSNDV